MNQARLTTFLRLTVYSFLNLKEVATKAAMLNKSEREDIKESEIVRENKHFTLKVFRVHCILQENNLEKYMQRYFMPITLSKRIRIIVTTNWIISDEIYPGDELAAVVASLPDRFDH